MFGKCQVYPGATNFKCGKKTHHTYDGKFVCNKHKEAFEYDTSDTSDTSSSESECESDDESWRLTKACR